MIPTFLFICVSCRDPYSGDSPWNTDLAPKYVFLMIADGSGYNHLVAANCYRGVESQRFENFPVRLGMSTFEFGGSYITQDAWENFAYVTLGATDSASAATALSTGIKTSNGRIGMNEDGIESLVHAMTYAEGRGFSTGVVTSVEWSHATPAGFVAHNADRNRYSQIALEMIFSSRTDVIIGCGHPLFDNDGNARTDGGDYTFVGGVAAWDFRANEGRLRKIRTRRTHGNEALRDSAGRNDTPAGEDEDE
jgi:alkaline phosphatase